MTDNQPDPLPAEQPPAPVGSPTPADSAASAGSPAPVGSAAPVGDPARLSPRHAEVAEALAAVRARITRACEIAHRDPAEVSLLAVTKTFPAADAAVLADLGVTQFGENRDAEAAAKTHEFAELRPGVTPSWHMVGRLQRNKARSVARWASMVQSVDSDRLADALDKAAAQAIDAGERSGPLDVLVQVSLDGDPARGGCPVPEVPALADRIAEGNALRLSGVMTVVPLNQQVERLFEQFSIVANRLRDDHPQAIVVSAGMSGDLEAAIGWGSTWVRVGTALLGTRRLTSPAGVEKGLSS